MGIFSGSQTDPCFQNKNSGYRLTGYLANKRKSIWLLLLHSTIAVGIIHNSQEQKREGSGKGGQILKELYYSILREAHLSRKIRLKFGQKTLDLES